MQQSIILDIREFLELVAQLPQWLLYFGVPALLLLSGLILAIVHADRAFPLTRLLFFIPFPQKKKKDRDEDIYAAFHAPLDEEELLEEAPLVMSAEEGELQLAHVDSLIGSLREKELTPADRLELDAVVRTLEDCRGRALTAAEQRTLNDCLSSVLKLSAKYSL